MADIKEINGRSIYLTGVPFEPLVGYSRAVRVGDTIAVSGCTATVAEGGHVGDGDAYIQTKRCLENIKESVEKLGGSMADVARTRMYVVDIERDWRKVAMAHQEAFADILPTTSMVQVSKLISPWMLIEVEADAIVTRKC